MKQADALLYGRPFCGLSSRASQLHPCEWTSSRLRQTPRSPPVTQTGAGLPFMPVSGTLACETYVDHAARPWLSAKTLSMACALGLSPSPPMATTPPLWRFSIRLWGEKAGRCLQRVLCAPLPITAFEGMASGLSLANATAHVLAALA